MDMDLDVDRDRNIDIDISMIHTHIHINTYKLFGNSIYLTKNENMTLEIYLPLLSHMFKR